MSLEMESFQLPEGQRSSLPTPGGSGRRRLHGQPLTSPAVRRRLGTISAGALALGLTALAFKTYHLFDFRVFWDAGHRLLTGARLYPSEGALDANTRNYYVYPPVVAFAFAPLSLIPYAVAGVLFAVASVAAIFASLRIVGVSDWRCYAVLPFWMPVLQAVGLGTIAPFLAVALAVAWRYRDRPFVGTAALGLAIASKLFLWPIVFWLIATRRYRRALETTGVTAAAIVIPWAALGFRDFAEYPRVLRLLVRNELPTSFSAKTLAGMLGFGPAALALQLACVVAVFALARRQEGDRRAFSAAILAALALSPLVWIHYYVLLIVPIGLAARRLNAVWLLPILAFWVYTDNLSSVWPLLWVSLVMAGVAVLTLRRWPSEPRGSFGVDESRSTRTSSRAFRRKSGEPSLRGSTTARPMRPRTAPPT
jgi:alpha-1,2-mannosyltransferase